MDLLEIADLFGSLEQQVWLITAAAGVQRGGLIATFVTSASIVPELPRVLVGVARQHFTWQLIEQAGSFAVHLLADEHLPWVWRFGLQSGRHCDKFEGLSIRAGTTGSPGEHPISLVVVLDGHIRPERVSGLVDKSGGA